MENFIELKNVKKTYNIGDQKYNALDGINLSIAQGEFVVILGPSGAGKSTLLNLLGGMDKATSGSIFIGENDIAKYNDKELTRYRANDVGFIFQFYNIMPTLTVLENINLIKDVTNTSKDAKEVLKGVGLLKHADKFPQELSGGEQQRVSIARAIMKNPKVLLCDEPIGAVLIISLSKIFVPILPVLLSFAAGAMIYVVVEELIPEANCGEHSNIGVIGVSIGFVLMMILDVALG